MLKSTKKAREEGEVMELEQAIREIDHLARKKKGKPLNEPERLVIAAAWDDLDYKQVAESSTYSTNYLKNHIAPGVWELLSKNLGNGKRITKKKLRQFFEQRHSPQEAVEPVRGTLEVMGGLPPNTSGFSGRAPELAMLKAAILEDRCVALVGLAGIGKSALAAKLVEEVRLTPQLVFNTIIWKSISHAPSFRTLAGELIELLASSNTDLTEQDFPEKVEELVSVLIHLLRSRHCLLVLDSAESVLQGNRNLHANAYGEQYRDYGIFFERLSKEQHQSCTILTSQEPFEDIVELQSRGQAARSVKITGLGKDAVPIFRAAGLKDEQVWGELINKYRGNPMNLQVVASQIRELFGGSVKSFLNADTTFISDTFKAFLSKQLAEAGHLTDPEREIIFYFAELDKKSQGISFTKLLEDAKTRGIPTASTSELMKSLNALDQRALVEKLRCESDQNLYRLEPIVQKYVVANLL